MDENLAFINWRKEIQQITNDYPEAVITPFEKNLEVWK